MIGKIIGIVFLLIIIYFAWGYFSDFKSTPSNQEKNMFNQMWSQPAERATAPYNAGRDIVLSRENPNIPSSAWNP